MMRRLLPLLAVALLALQLAGCGAGNDRSTASSPGADAEASQSASPSHNHAVPAPSPSAGQPTLSSEHSESPRVSEEKSALHDAAKDVVEALRDRDLKRLAGWIDGERGLRFSPYAHLDAKSGLVFKAGQLPSFRDADKLEWGVYDGSGEPISLTFRDYFEKFVYDQDFADAPDMNENKLKGKGNSAYNGQEVYPGSSFVEFHYPGFDDKLEGQDWESLILTFVPSGRDWRLCAVTHAQWTI
ncbi:hypothetical protein [Cohnella zeiphila]|uniref:DUF3993 domain-containing protein n=1 Tax=Cohnella zeiphila TaxID=2761120 RepID=A0A7X0SN24_9BACL|nr:hypothetical protein [Cohnella zeiphila]MBB6733033.1 hypothetical protein [Cohnella zeiphila]